MLQPSEEIKSKLDIVEVIREYIQLKPAGINFRANCPFHHEKSPSFIVSPEKQIWHCFGCSKGGDVFSFVMEMEGLSFVEALRSLAPKAGVTLTRQNPELTSQRNRLLDIIDISKNYYHRIMLDSASAAPAREYLLGRGLTDETIGDWQIGFSPSSWDDLINLLKKKGYQDNEIFLAGMSVKKEGTSRFYNRFRGRIMFPINDISGNAVGFTARVSPENEETEKMGKYINSPQTMIYDKSGILFGLDKAKQEIKKRDLAILVEGQMDVITAHQNGWKNVVASSGTALTGNQIIILKRYSNNISLAFDMDKAGEMAADRGIKEAMRADLNTKIIEVPHGKDPDECIRNNKTAWETAVKNAKPVMQYYFDKTFSDLDLEQVENKREAVRKLLPTIAKIGNEIEKDFWLNKLSQILNVREDVMRETLSKLTAAPETKAPIEKREEAGESQKERKYREELLSELFITLIIKFPSLIDYVVGRIDADHIIGEGNRSLYKDLVLYYNNLIDTWTQEGGNINPPQISYEALKQWLNASADNYNEEVTAINAGQSRPDNQFNSPSSVQLLDKLALLGDKDFFELENEQAKNEIIKIIIHLKKHFLNNRKKEIQNLIAQAEASKDENSVERLLEEFKSLTDEINEIER